MKSVVFSLCVLLLLSVVFLHYRSGVSSIRYGLYTKNIKTIRAINPKDTIYDDLYFFKDLLKNVKVVMLGEAQHGDGSTFLAKTRLIEFLHKQLGFEMVAFESGWLDMCSAYQRADKDISKSVFWFWSESRQTEYLWDYAKKSNLLMVGFDYQLSSNGFNGYYKTIFAQVIKDDPNFLLINDKHNLLDSLFYYTTEGKNNLSIAQKQSILQDILSKQKSYKAYRIGLNLEVLYQLLYVSWILKNNNNFINNSTIDKYRDSVMAHNLLDIVRNTDKKVIVWAANTHIMRGEHHFKILDDRDIYFPKRMGSYLKDSLGEACYAMLFTSHKGCTLNTANKKVAIINQSSINSFEYYLSKLGQNFLFLDFKNIPYKNDTISLKCQAHGNRLRPWFTMGDGLFYLKYTDAAAVEKH